MIRYADDTAVERLKQIWQECFGDETCYIDMVFDNLYRPENTLVYWEEDGPAGMLTMLPISLRLAGRVHRGRYLYAIATRKKSQGRGICTKLMEFAEQQMRAQGETVSVLVPASNSLFGFYGRRGYIPYFYLHSMNIETQTLPRDEISLPLHRMESSQFIQLRQERFGLQDGFIQFEPHELRFICLECRYQDGECLFFSKEGQEGYAICYRSGDVLVIKEMAVSKELFYPLLRGLDERYGCREYELRLPLDYPLTECPAVGKPFGMCKFLDGTDPKKLAMNASPFLGLALD